MAEETTASRHPRGRSPSLPAAMVIGAALVAGSAGPAAAQDPNGNGAQDQAQNQQPQNQQPPANGPQTVSPFWEHGPAGQPGAAGARGYPPYPPRDRDRDFSENFPVDLTAEVAPAHARYVALKWSHQAAQNQLRDQMNLLRRQYEDSEEYRDLQRQRSEAQARLQQAEQEALEPLADDPEYNAVVELEGDLERQIREAHQQPGTDPARIRGMAELAMSYSQRRREMETSLTSTSSEVQQARERLREITREQNALEDDYRRQVREDESLAMLRQQISQLRVAYLAAGAYYDTAVRAANIATDFAYYNAFAQGGGVTNPYLPYRYGYPFAHHFHPWTGGLIIAGPTVPGVRLHPTVPSNVIRGGPRHTMQRAPEVTNQPRPGAADPGGRQRTRD